MSINYRECWSGSTKWTIHRNWQRMSHKTKNKNQTKTSKTRTQCALDSTIRKQTQITLIRHGPSYKQLDVKTNQPSFVCGNHNTEPKAKRHIIGEHKTLKRWATRILMTGKSCVTALHLWVQSVFINIDRNLTALFNQINTNLKKY
jgi:tRNA pseudouridine-54 N-methylase